MKSDNADDPVVIVDWECVVDALPYYVDLGIYAARQVWLHLHALCNWDRDEDWLHNKLYAISHVVPHPDLNRNHHGNGGGTTDTNLDDHHYHHHYQVGCKFAFATRLLLEEQAKDRNASTGKQVGLSKFLTIK